MHIPVLSSIIRYSLIWNLSVISFVFSGCSPGTRKDVVHKRTIDTKSYSAGKDKCSDFCNSLSPVGRILEFKDWNVWCCSPIYDDPGNVHVFFSRWRGEHNNWLSNSEIAHAFADKPEGPYQLTGTILKGQGEGHWDANTIHNPTIHKVGNYYALFYIGNNLQVADMNNAHHASTQRIGLAISEKLQGPYKRVGNDGLIVDVSKNSEEWDSYLTTNPALLQHPNGEYWLYYKSWDRNNDDLRKMGVAIAKNILGPYIKYEGNPIIDFSDLGAQVEDAYVWYEDGSFHMIMRDMGVINPRIGLYLTSDDGLNWSEPEIGYRENIFYFPDEKLERFERPQLLVKNNRSEYLFMALNGGKYGKSSAAVLKINHECVNKK